MSSTAPIVELVKPRTSLATADQKLLTELEAKVESGMMAFAEALYRIRSHKDGLLWKSQGYASFEEYCRARFDFQKQHAYRLAATGEFVSKLDNGVPLPLRESQVRPILNKLEDPRQRVEFWKGLVANEDPKKLTAGDIEEKVLEFRKEHTPKTKTKKVKAKAPTETDDKTDRIRQRCQNLIGRLEEACEGLPLEEQILSVLKELEKLVNRKRKPSD